jgi:anti-sigma factor RsiW
MVSASASSAYRIFASDEVRPVEVSATNKVQMVNWMAGRLGQRIMPPDLTQAGYELMGGRVVATPAGPAAMFLYEDSKGMRISVYAQPMNNRDASMRPIEAAGVNGYVWMNNKIGYGVVSAPGQPADVHALADQVRDKMNQRT